MPSPTYANKATLGQFTRTLTGSAIALSSTPLLVAKAYICNPSGNDAATIGFASDSQLISIAADARFDLDISAFEGMRFDLNEVYIDGTNNDVVTVIYFA